MALYPSSYVCTCIVHTCIIHAYIHTYFIQCIMHNNSCTYIHIILCLCFHDSIVLIGYVNTRQRFTVFGSSSTIHLHEAASSLKQPASLAYGSTNPATQTLQSTSVRLYCIRHHLCYSQPPWAGANSIRITTETLQSTPTMQPPLCKGPLQLAY